MKTAIWLAGVLAMNICVSEPILNVWREEFECLCDCTHPVLRIEVQVLHFPVLKEACQSNSIVSQMRLFTNDNDIVFSALCVKLQDFLAVRITFVRP